MNGKKEALKLVEKVAAGYIVHWYKKSDGTGYTCTNGANQKVSLTLVETGYKMDVGLMKCSTGTKYPVFLSSTKYNSNTISKTYNMQYTTAAYKPYVYNKDNISMTLNEGGTFTLN